MREYNDSFPAADIVRAARSVTRGPNSDPTQAQRQILASYYRAHRSNRTLRQELRNAVNDALCNLDNAFPWID